MAPPSEQERIRGLIKETLMVLCKSSLTHHSTFRVEGLLGITVDDKEVFLVNINDGVPSTTPPTCKDSADYHRL